MNGEIEINRAYSPFDLMKKLVRLMDIVSDDDFEREKAMSKGVSNMIEILINIFPVLNDAMTQVRQHIGAKEARQFKADDMPGAIQ